MSGLLHSVKEHRVLKMSCMYWGYQKNKEQAKIAPASPAADVIASLKNTDEFQ